MFSDPEPEDERPQFDEYDLQWVLIYTLIAWAVVCALALPALIVPRT